MVEVGTRSSHHPSIRNARVDAGSTADLGVLCELVGRDKVRGQMDLHVVLRRLVHQLLHDRRAVLVEQRVADLQMATISGETTL